MRKKSLAALCLAVSMSLSMSLLSYAQQPSVSEAENTSETDICPLIIKGQRVVIEENVSTFGNSGSGVFGRAILAGADHIEESDFVVEKGTIVEKQLNSDNGKLPEFDMSKATSLPTKGIPGEADIITIKDNDNTHWMISLYRLPDSMSSAGELKEYSKYAIYANGYSDKTAEIGWQHNEQGYWYNCGNGVYPANEWKEIDGKFYYFNVNGYMWPEGWTPDGSYVDASGAWVPGYDEELRENATVIYNKYFYDESGNMIYERHEVPVSKVSEINDLYDNFKENEVPEVDRLSAIWIYAKSN